MITPTTAEIYQGNSSPLENAINSKIQGKSNNSNMIIEYIMTYFLRFVFHQINIPPIMPIINSPIIYSILSLMFQIF